MQLFFTSRTFDSAADYIEKRGKNFNVDWVIEKYTAQIDEVLTRCGMADLKPAKIPKSLFEHPKWGKYIAALTHPWKKCKNLVRTENMIHELKLSLKQIGTVLRVISLLSLT